MSAGVGPCHPVALSGPAACRNAHNLRFWISRPSPHYGAWNRRVQILMAISATDTHTNSRMPHQATASSSHSSSSARSASHPLGRQEHLGARRRGMHLRQAGSASMDDAYCRWLRLGSNQHLSSNGWPGPSGGVLADRVRASIRSHGRR